MIKRRDMLLGLYAAAGLGLTAQVRRSQDADTAVLASQLSDADFAVRGNASLKERAAAKGVVYGAAVMYRDIEPDPAVATAYERECALIIPENELKWKRLRPEPDEFNFREPDWLLNFANRRGMLTRGHTLVWHRSLPTWFDERVNRQNAERYLVEHIQTVVRHYAGRLHSWDVVNEAINPEDDQQGGWRRSPWYEFLGPEYVDLAFRVAAEADPNTMLVYNDHRMDHDAAHNRTKRAAVLRMLEGMKARGVPIHALGTQGHLRAGRTINARALQTFVRDVASLGLKVMVTELDVIDQDLPADVEVRDRLVAQTYEEYLSIMLNEPDVIAVMNWSLSDRHSWLRGSKAREDGLPVRPLPLDSNLQRKLAWQAMARAFDQAPRRPRWELTRNGWVANAQ